MAFIYNLTDSWNDVTTTWNGIKLAVTNTASDSSSKLLNLTVSGATTASFTVDKSGNLDLNGKINKITFTAPATAATFTLADNSTFATVGGYASTFTFTGATSVTFPTSGTVTALGNTTTGSGGIVLATSPTLVSPALGTPSSGTLTNCTGFPASGLSGLGAGVATWLGTPSSANLRAAVTDETGTGSLVFATSPSLVTPDLGTPSAATLTNATGLPISTGVSGLGSGVATFLGTPSSANLAAAVTDETGSGPLVFATSPTFTSAVTLGTQSSTRGSLVLANTTAGSKAVTLQSSNSTAAAYTLTLPAASPVNGYYLQTDNLGQLSWAAGGGGGGGSPGGSNTQIQYNNAGAFGGDAAFTFTNGGSTATMSLGVASTTSGVAKLYNSASANAITIASGNNASAWTMTLPTTPGTNGYAMVTDGSGNMSWSAIAAGTINTGTVGQITYYSGTNALSSATTGTGVLTALGVNTGSTGAFVVNGGALGTPLTGTLTNCTGYTVGNLSGAGTGVVTALGNATNGASGLVTLNASSQLPAVDGSSLTTLNASNISSGTLAVARGGSGATATTGSGNNVLSASPTLTGTISAASMTLTGDLNPSSSFIRNKLINGAMRIWQRGTSNTSINNSPTYVADRWYGFVGASVTEEQIIQSTDVPTGFLYSSKWGRPAGNTQTNSIWFCQNVESVNMLDTIGQNVTLSFYAKKGANYSGGNVTVRVATGTTADQSAATFSGGPASGYTGYSALIDTTQSLTTSWVRYTFTSSGAVASNALEMAVAFGFTPSGTAGADDNIYITGVQLEVGSVATPFERRQYGQELALCQRYYYSITPAASNKVLGFGFASSSTGASCTIPLPVVFRATPTLSVTSTASDYSVAYKTSTITCSAVPTLDGVSSQWSVALSFSFATGSISAGEAIQTRTGSTAGYIGLSAEL